MSELISAAADGYAERHSSPFTGDLADAAADDVQDGRAWNGEEQRGSADED